MKNEFILAFNEVLEKNSFQKKLSCRQLSLPWYQLIVVR
jgi:hypothetical protein